MTHTNPRSAQELMHENLIIKHYAGSHAYGTNITSSDVDFRGIFVADPINVRTPFYTIKEVDDTSEEDTKLYELSQFMKLALDCNPNIIETLWTNSKHIVYQHPAFNILYDARYELLSSKIAFTTSGYALSQLKRIKGHNKWINSPQPIDPPIQIDFISLVHNFTSEKMFKVDLRNYKHDYRLVSFGGETYGLFKVAGYTPFADNGSLNTDFEGDSHELGTPDIIIKFNKAVYITAKETHSHYWEWKKNRNIKRSELEEKFGFDTKHAMHLVRLLRMGAEVLQTGELNVYRPDAVELLSIRNGAWTYEQIVKYAEEMDQWIRGDLYPKTALRKTPNIELAAKLTLEVQDYIWIIA